MEFVEATRAGTKALIGIYGESGSGKTYSALMMGRGLAGPDGLLMLIDTENRRGEMYSDVIPGGYKVLQLTEPYSSDRYGEAIQRAEQAAAGRPACLVIDSFSHEWEGAGGVVSAAEAIAEAAAAKYNRQWDGSVQFGHWKTPKQKHKHMMLKMLGSPMHIICCLRAQYASHQVEQKDYAKYGITSKARTTVIRDEFQTPIQDKKFIFEMTANIELSNQRPGVPILRKCPEMLRQAFDANPQLSVDTGERIAQWTDMGALETKADADLEERAQAKAYQGTEVYKEFFQKLTAAERDWLNSSGRHLDFKADAADADVALKENADASL